LVFDVGSNLGIYACIAAKRGARVIAFEPSRSVILYLERHITINNFENQVTVVSEAVAEAPGTVTFYEGDAKRSGIGRIFAYGQIASDRARYDVDTHPLGHYFEQFG